VSRGLSYMGPNSQTTQPKAKLFVMQGRKGAVPIRDPQGLPRASSFLVYVSSVSCSMCVVWCVVCCVGMAGVSGVSGEVRMSPQCEPETITCWWHIDSRRICLGDLTSVGTITNTVLGTQYIPLDSGSPMASAGSSMARLLDCVYWIPLTPAIGRTGYQHLVGMVLSALLPLRSDKTYMVCISRFVIWWVSVCLCVYA